MKQKNLTGSFMVSSFKYVYRKHYLSSHYFESCVPIVYSRAPITQYYYDSSIRCIPLPQQKKLEIGEKKVALGAKLLVSLAA